MLQVQTQEKEITELGKGAALHLSTALDGASLEYHILVWWPCYTWGIEILHRHREEPQKLEKRALEQKTWGD